MTRLFGGYYVGFVPESIAQSKDFSFWKVGDIKHCLPENEFCRFVTDESQKAGCQDFYEVLGRKFQMTISIEMMEKSIMKLWEEYGDRARQAEQNKGIDWKAISHAMRGGYQLISIFEEGTIQYPLKDTEFLKSVKLGEVEFSVAHEKLENIMDQVEISAAKSNYPKEADRQFWETFVADIYAEHVKGYYK